MALSDYLDARRGEIDAALDRFLPAEAAAPAIITAAMRYSLMAGGKRLRPILTLAAAEAVSSSDEARRLALPVACAIEMIHTYSLIHDDLPAMDDDDLRRGRPTSHVVHGEGMAILAGDGLQAEAFALIAREPAIDDSTIAARKLRTIAVVAEAAGANGMVGGQAVDLSAIGEGAQAFDGAALRDMHARKTGALIRAAVVSGAVMAGGSPALVAALTRYAGAIGLAFQIVDDILDVEGASAHLGKTPGKDAAAGKPTYPSIYGLETSRTLAQESLSRALAALADAGHQQSRLAEIARWIVNRTH